MNRLKSKKVLLIVDLQNDFCPGGALAVPQGNKIVPVVNKYIKLFLKNKWPVFASADWHPARTSHFKDFGGSWPVHCIQNTRGALFHVGLKLPKNTVIVYKGMDPQKEGYSAFQAEDARGVGLLKLLRMQNIQELYICGLATDYCVKSSVLDALKHGLKVKLLVDAIRGVDLKPKDSECAIKQMIRKGAKAITIKDIGKGGKRQ